MALRFNDGMRPRAAKLALAALALVVPACSQPTSPPTKMIKAPKGGEPVLTAAERVAPAGQVALASYQQQVLLPHSAPLKPIDQWTEQETAADALGRIGAPAVPALMQALQSPDPNVRAKAAEVLGRMGADARDAVPELIRLLDDPDERIRKAATRALGRIGPAAQEAVPGLMRSLFQTSPEPPTG